VVVLEQQAGVLKDTLLAGGIEPHQHLADRQDG